MNFIKKIIQENDYRLNDKNNNIKHLDNVKWILTLLIVLYHIGLPYQNKYESLFYLIKNLGDGAVHAFALISGFLFFKTVKKFEDLDRSIQRTIEETEIVTYQMEPQTPKEVRYSVFNRINTGGLTLNPQEIRQALNQKNRGVKLLEEIAETEEFKRIVNVTSKRMVDRELVLRFIAFKKFDYTKLDKEIKTLARLLDETMEEVDSKEFEQIEFIKLKDSLLKTLLILEEIFGSDKLFNRKLIDEKKIRSLNKSLFEIWTVLISNCTEEEQNILKKQKENLIERYKRLLLSQEFNDSITKGTNDRKVIVKRFSLLEELIRGVIDDKKAEIK